MKSTLKAAIARLMRRLGYELIPTWRLNGLPLATHLREVFRRFSVDTVFDIGANSGQYHDFLRDNVKFSGVIHSFEPVARLADKIAARANADPEWYLHRYALGSQEATREINVTARDTFSSFLEAGVEDDSPFAASMTVARREQVPIKRLDDVWRNLCSSDPTRLYVKVDTQGFDMEVLRGGTELLRSVMALQFELAIQPLYKDTLDYLDMLRRMNELGFEVSGLFPISTDDHLRAVEFDCVMVARRP